MDNIENNKELTTGVIDLDQIRIDKEDNADSVIKVESQIEEEQEKESQEIAELFSFLSDSHGEALFDLSSLTSFLALDNDKFDILSEYFLSDLEKQLEEPKSRIFLQQAMTATGIEPSQLKVLQQDILKELDEKLIAFPKNKKDFLKKIMLLITNVYFDIGKGRKIINIPIELTDADAIIPKYARVGDGAVDLYATEDYEIVPGETKMISTGIKVAIPDGYALLIQARSGMSAKTKLRVANTPGLIDSGYRGEIKVIMENIEPKIKNITYEFNDNPQKNTNEVSPIIKSIEEGQSYFIERGQRFAQMRLVPAPMANFIQVDSVQEIGEDRQSGFGGTGDR